jgi:hypothetical protein
MAGFTAFAGCYLPAWPIVVGCCRGYPRLRDRLYDQLQHLPCSYFDLPPPAIWCSARPMLKPCGGSCDQVVEIGRAVLMMLVPASDAGIDWRMTAMSVVYSPIVAFSMVFFRRVRPRQAARSGGRAVDRNAAGKPDRHPSRPRLRAPAIRD